MPGKSPCTKHLISAMHSVVFFMVLSQGEGGLCDIVYHPSNMISFSLHFLFNNVLNKTKQKKIKIVGD